MELLTKAIENLEELIKRNEYSQKDKLHNIEIRIKTLCKMVVDFKKIFNLNSNEKNLVIIEHIKQFRSKNTNTENLMEDINYKHVWESLQTLKINLMMKIYSNKNKCKWCKAQDSICFKCWSKNN